MCDSAWLYGAANASEGMYMRIVVPGIPPSVNHMYRRHTLKDGRRINVTTSKAKAWLDAASLCARVAANAASWECVPTGQKVIVRLWFYWPNRHRRDTHNTLKACLDAWQGVLYEDDQYALPRIMDWQIDKQNPRIEAEIVLYEEAKTA